MSVLKAVKDLSLFPIRAVKQIKDDLTAEDETKIVLSVFTLGTSSALKALGKTIDKIYDDLED